MFKDIYRNKKVLITGNTGFKGAWLSVWLLNLGADVYGVSIDVPTNPSIFEETGLNKTITHFAADIRDGEQLRKIFAEVRPDFVFHLAAQPIVSESYRNPVDTFVTNAIGTANVLETLRQLKNPCTAVLITSDKCYENVEWIWGYRETDALGGKDPYSASKGAAELVIHSYYESFFSRGDSHVKIASVRAGNVIGGGDWAANRIVPDAMKAWSNDLPVTIRNPKSTRPWQHVLEPIGGYLLTGMRLQEDSSINGQAFNFGPNADQNFTVAELLNELVQYWKFSSSGEKVIVETSSSFHEAGLLKLNCDKALHYMHWKPVLDFKQTAQLTAQWYVDYYAKGSVSLDYMQDQIQRYLQVANEKQLKWCSA